jgi:hypothetical protein
VRIKYCVAEQITCVSAGAVYARTFAGPTQTGGATRLAVRSLAVTQDDNLHRGAYHPSLES